MHDQNFKNLILDYPRQALTFFAAEEAGEDLAEARIVPIRQEQLPGTPRRTVSRAGCAAARRMA